MKFWEMPSEGCPLVRTRPHLSVRCGATCLSRLSAGPCGYPATSVGAGQLPSPGGEDCLAFLTSLLVICYLDNLAAAVEGQPLLPATTDLAESVFGTFGERH